MICELSSDVFRRAAAKAKGSRKEKFEYAADESQCKETFPIITKLQKQGFKLENVETEDNNCFVYMYKEGMNLTFQIYGNSSKCTYRVYDYGTDEDENTFIEYSGKKVIYPGLKTSNRKEIKAIVDFGKICGFEVDKNELIA